MPKTRKIQEARPSSATRLPSRDDIVAFVERAPGKVGKREIAKAFGLKGGDRIWIKQMLAELAESGALASRRRRLVRTDRLPNVVVAEIVGRDADGECLARPVQWEGDGAAPRILVLPSRRGPAPGPGDRALLRVEPDATEAGRYDGRIVKVLPRERSSVLGVYRSGPAGGRVVPVDKRALGREIAIPAGEENGARDGDLVSVAPDGGGRARPGGPRLGLTRGRVRERLGSLSSERAVSLIALHANDIPHVFPPDALAEADAARPVGIADREDWRALPLVTIDPPDAKDHDDAVHAAPDPDPKNPGGHVVTVAIADVAAYVRPGSALDREAARRGNSVYFPDRVVPMLPERISNDLCSLKEGEDRPALAVRMVFGADGTKRGHAFHRIAMRSAARLAYAEAQAAVDRQADPRTAPLVEPILRPLYAAYAALTRAREARAPLELDLPERKVLLGADGKVDRVVVPARLDAHRLIEEFMIQANVAAAETLEKAGSPLLYRAHDEPAQEKMRALGEVLASIGIKLPKDGALRPALFNRILATVAGGEHAPFVNEIVLRSQAQALYTAESRGHFGLNLRRYAHFTSPIRRYADLVVHRALVRALRLGDDGLPDGTTPAMLAEVGSQVSAAERRAMAAERDTVDRLIAHHLADRVGTTFAGRIAGVTRAGLFVKLDETGADGFVPVATIGAEYFRHDERRHALVGERSGTSHRLGDPVEVRLVEAAPVAGALRFELLSEGRRSGTGRARPPGGPKRTQTSRRDAKRAGRPARSFGTAASEKR